MIYVNDETGWQDGGLIRTETLHDILTLLGQVWAPEPTPKPRRFRHTDLMQRCAPRISLWEPLSEADYQRVQHAAIQELYRINGPLGLYAGKIVDDEGWYA